MLNDERDFWRCRCTLMKEESGRIYSKVELRSEASPSHISFVNVHLDRTQEEIERNIKYAAAMLAEHQNAKIGDNHKLTEIEKGMWDSFRRMMVEIAEAGVEL